MNRACLLLGVLACSLPSSYADGQTVTVTLDNAAVAPKTRLGIGVNGSGGWYHFVGAILVDDPSFEGPADGNGFAKDGWPWYSSGTLSAAVDTATRVTGAQSQRVTVSAAPAAMNQGRTALPQLPLVMTARPGGNYRIKVQVRSEPAGARLKLGVLNDGWQGVYGPELTAAGDWQVVYCDYVPAAEHLLRGISVQFLDNATYWLDDLVAWDTTDVNAATGLNGTLVERLRELRPATLRLGGLGVNGIPLESYLRPQWPRDYGPPGLQPDFDLDTFLALCREVGADPFITVPPAFSDGGHWQQGDLTDEVVAGVVADHGNLVDYIGGDAATGYGARREAAGHPRWDQQLGAIYFELGNELWGTPDGKWDMDLSGSDPLEQQMQRYGTYCQARITEMKGRPGWRPNMKVGFAGRSPDIWIGQWPGSYDHTLIPMIGSLVDFSTIDLYYGNGSGTDSDDAIYGALFANAVWHEREIGRMKAAFRAANGGADIETMVYEGNATWGPYESDLINPSPLYGKEVSLGAAVSLLDVYAAANRAGLTVNNHFHIHGNIWSATGPYPQVLRKPAYFALKVFNHHLAGDLVGCSIAGAGSYDDPLTGEQGVPLVACYPYKNGDDYAILLINRDRVNTREVVVAARLAPLRQILLSAADPNANNETTETVFPQETVLSGQLQDEIPVTIPPFSALVLQANSTGGPSGDEEPAGADGGEPQADAEDGAGSSDGADGNSAGDGGDGDGSGPEAESCSCGAGARLSLPWLGLALLALGLRRGRSPRRA